MLSKDLKEFIQTNFRSVEDLEILLFVRNNPKQDWDALKIAQELKSEPISVSNQLMSLYLKGLITQESQKGRLSPYRYSPRPSVKESRLAELERVFRTSRDEVTDYIGRIRRGSNREAQRIDGTFLGSQHA